MQCALIRACALIRVETVFFKFSYYSSNAVIIDHISASKMPIESVNSIRCNEKSVNKQCSLDIIVK